MIIDKSIVRESSVPFALLLAQLVLALFVALQFLVVIGFSFDIATRQLSFGFSGNPLEYFFLFLSAGLLYIIFSKSQRKNEDVFVAGKMFPYMFKSTASFKLWTAKNEPKIIALLLIEFVFVITVAMSILAYLDPEFSIIKWEKLNIYGPIATILNIALFLATLLLFYYLYNITKPYRAQRKKTK